MARIAGELVSGLSHAVLCTYNVESYHTESNKCMLSQFIEQSHLCDPVRYLKSAFLRQKYSVNYTAARKALLEISSKHCHEALHRAARSAVHVDDFWEWNVSDTT